MASKKYYWLKLKEDFFGQKEIKKLRRIAGGDTYTIIYLKMLLTAIKQDNKLYFEGVEDTFAEELALEFDESSENIKVTLSFLQAQKLIQLVEEDEFLLTKCSEMVGSETPDAVRKRKVRERQKQEIPLELPDNCGQFPDGVQKSPTEIEKEIEIDTEIEKDICPEPEASGPEEAPFITLPLNTGEEYPVYSANVREFEELYPAVDVPQAMRDMRGWLLNNKTRRKTRRGIGKFMNSWLAKEQDSAGNKPYQRAYPTAADKYNRFMQNNYDYDSLEQELLKK